MWGLCEGSPGFFFLSLFVHIKDVRPNQPHVSPPSKVPASAGLLRPLWPTTAVCACASKRALVVGGEPLRPAAISGIILSRMAAGLHGHCWHFSTIEAINWSLTLHLSVLSYWHICVACTQGSACVHVCVCMTKWQKLKQNHTCYFFHSYFHWQKQSVIYNLCVGCRQFTSDWESELVVIKKRLQEGFGGWKQHNGCWGFNYLIFGFTQNPILIICSVARLKRQQETTWRYWVSQLHRTRTRPCLQCSTVLLYYIDRLCLYTGAMALNIHFCPSTVDRLARL